MVLGKSKTSGPDKVQKEVSVHVFRTVSLTGLLRLYSKLITGACSGFTYDWFKVSLRCSVR